MLKNTLKIKNAQQLSRDEQRSILGGAGGGTTPPDLSLCGCDCAGSVSGPSYCIKYIACPQVYTCDDDI